VAFTTRRRVEFRDTDAAGIAHFSAFFFWMESVEHELLRAAGVAVVDRDVAGSEASWPRVSAECDYTSSVRFGDELEVVAGIVSIGRTSLTYGFRFAHEGRPVAEGRIVAVHCLMHAGTKPEPVAISAEIREKLEPYHMPRGPMDQG